MPDYDIAVSEHGDIDQNSGIVPEWCDVSIDVQSDVPLGAWYNLSDKDLTLTMYMTRDGASLLSDSLHETLHRWTGGSIIATFCDRLDYEVKQIMEHTKKGEHAPEFLKARALAMAEFIAFMSNPYNPNVDAVRDAAMERYYSKESA